MDTIDLIHYAPHNLEPVDAGKFDCPTDARIYDITLEEEYDGEAEAPTGWWVPITLDVDDDAELIEHYGSRWLIGRGNGQGSFWTLAFVTEQGRDRFGATLAREFSTWNEAGL